MSVQYLHGNLYDKSNTRGSNPLNLTDSLTEEPTDSIIRYNMQDKIEYKKNVMAKVNIWLNVGDQMCTFPY